MRPLIALLVLVITLAASAAAIFGLVVLLRKMSRKERTRAYRALLAAISISGIVLLSIPSTRTRIGIGVMSLSLNLGLARTLFPVETVLELELYASGLTQPVYALPDPENSDRFFIVERAGTIRILANGVPRDTPFLDLTEQVTFSGVEQGLLGMAFHPEYAENGFFYVYYTGLSNDSVLARYTVSSDNPDVANPNSAEILLTIEQPFINHNGGLLIFGPDGHLYLGLGDGGIGEDMRDEAQDRSNLLGSILRLDVSQPDEGPPYYDIPPDNPFIDEPDVRPEIWAYGLRNPWRFTFDQQSGDIYIADVGDILREEINHLPIENAAGANYGWHGFEGSQVVRGWGDGNPQAKVFPVAEYAHTAQGGCAVIGGYVYRGQAIPQLQGKYLYADSCTSFVWTLEHDGSGQWITEKVLDEELFISSFVQDADGELYLLNLSKGEMYKIIQMSIANN